MKTISVPVERIKPSEQIPNSDWVNALKYKMDGLKLRFKIRAYGENEASLKIRVLWDERTRVLFIVSGSNLEGVIIVNPLDACRKIRNRKIELLIDLEPLKLEGLKTLEIFNRNFQIQYNLNEEETVRELVPFDRELIRVNIPKC